MKVEQYIKNYKKIAIIDKDNQFGFWSDGKSIIGGTFKVKDKRML